MNRDEIYDHLAQVYLGKRDLQPPKQDKQKFNAWLLINITITFVIFTSAFYGLTAFLTHQNSALKSRVIFALHNGTVRFEYNLNDPFPPTETFAVAVPTIDASKYKNLQFSMRGREEGVPGVVKIIVKNRFNEEASYYIQGVGMQWQEYSISLDEFRQITDWSHLSEISFCPGIMECGR